MNELLQRAKSEQEVIDALQMLREELLLLEAP
jgi:hypothetical protein